MISQNGSIPVPPQIKITFPAFGNSSYFKPEPIGFERMIYPLKFYPKNFEVTSPFGYLLIIKGMTSSFLKGIYYENVSSEFAMIMLQFVVDFGKCFYINSILSGRMHHIVV
jgi:hypothetical protein